MADLNERRGLMPRTGGAVGLAFRGIGACAPRLRCLVLSSVLTLALLIQNAEGRYGEAASGGPGGVATAGGVTLRLDFSKRSYPRNALVATTVLVRNGSGSQIVVQDPQCRADGPSPAVEVLARDGKVVFPPALPSPPLGGAQCKEGPPPPLAPGATLRLHYYVVLRGPLIRAVARIDVPQAQGSSTVGTSTTLATSVVRVMLTQRDAPRIRLLVHANVHAVVIVALSLRGRQLLYTDWYTCPGNVLAKVGGQGFKVDSGNANPITLRTLTGKVLSWRVSRSQLLRPGCVHPRQWYVAAGQLDHSVSVVHYSSPSTLAPE